MKAAKAIAILAVLAVSASIVSGSSECYAIGCGEIGSACTKDYYTCKHGTTCIDSICRYIKDGDACHNGDVCDHSEPGKPELYCNKDTEKCAVRPKLGEVCTDETDCQSDGYTVYCNRTSMSPSTGVCKKYGVAGEYCNRNNECDDKYYY